ncbi:alcohol dehydrogenase [Echinicola strongylocentroti]|uniref:alcohol dehydrogenase n=1 Tax=Echinicola strongylocentroti TaxID=1795355 RepID=A0A2Z4IN76_9BACT|nr:zinc-binding dehydrogenase [Echinicola strongylocentroti]AWW32197.1 alcohol dehydrogenase [Echinicola strongylocentroti]
MASTTAKAMVFMDANTPFSPATIDLPQLKEGELLVKNHYATICASDLHTFYGRRQSCGHSILGHEIIGIIKALAEEGVTDFFGSPLKVGDKITWSVYAHDPLSPTSKKGFPQKSEALYKYGHEQMNETYKLNGGFSSHCHLRKGTTIFRLPSSLTEKEAAPLNCTHATIAGALRLAGNLKGKNVLVNGVGMLGLSACAMAKENGAAQVWAQDLDPEKVAFSKAFGADHTLLFEGLESKELIDTHGEIDVIIETSGVPEAMEKCVQLLGIGGTIVLVGAVFPQRDLSVNAEYLVRNLLTIKGLHNYIPEDLAAAIEFLTAAASKYPFESLVGKEFPLGQLDSAFEAGNEGGYYRVGIKP